MINDLTHFSFDYKIITVLFVFCFFIIDNIIVLFASKRKQKIDDWNINCYKKYGVFTTTIIKIVVLVFQIDMLYDPVGRSAPLIIFIFYFLAVIMSIFNFFNSKKR